MSTLEINSPLRPIVAAPVWYQRLESFLPFTYLPWMLVAFVSISAGGAPGLKIPLAVYVILWVLWTYPVTAFVCIGVAKLLHRRDRTNQAILVLSVPTALGLLICLALIAPFAIGFVLYCMGQL